MSAASAGLIDPTKHGEYPILLGDKLAGKQSSKEPRFVNVNYNYKTKAASTQQKTVITRGQHENIYHLTIQDKAGNAEQTPLTYKYDGSVDPNAPSAESEYSNLVLVFDPKRKAFVLEPVSTKLNFNLRSAPGKTEQQIAEKYPRLGTLLDSARASGDDGNGGEDEPGPADESNPFDYRHFLPKAKSATDNTTVVSPMLHHVDPVVTAKPAKAPSRLTPSTAAAAANKKPLNTSQRSKAKANPLRPPKRAPAKPSPIPASSSSGKSKPPKSVPIPRRESNPAGSPQSEETATQNTDQLAASPSGSNIIVDGDLIIDMGSPPPQRPAYKINPRHFSSNNASANEDGYGSDEEDQELEDPQYGRRNKAEELDRGRDEEEQRQVQHVTEFDDLADEDALAAEMEAAFEEEAGAREEEQRIQQQRQHVISDDESEVSEEE